MGLGCSVPTLGQVQIIRTEVHRDVSPPLRDLANAAPQVDLTPRESEPLRRIPLPPGLKPAEEPDSVIQRTAIATPAAFAPTVGNSFDGIGQGQFSFFGQPAPPDTNGAVGLTQYVQWVNTLFGVFDKSTRVLTLGPIAGNTLWSGFGGLCETHNDGDPMVVYDKLANRWVLAQFAIGSTSPPFAAPFLQCIAISTTPDATGTYNRYSFEYSAFDDYPKMAVWPDAYYVTFNMFDVSTNPATFIGSDACAYDRSAMINGQPSTQICFQQGPSVGGLLPSDLDGSTPPPPGSPNYMVYFGTNSLNLFQFHADFGTPSASTFTGPAVIPVAPFTPLCNATGTCVPQAGTTNQLDSLGDRLMHRLAYRDFGTHESLVVNHSVDAAPGGGVRWYEIQNPAGTPSVAQQSTFAPDSNFRWMGSIAMDKAGDIAVGYSLSGSSMKPAIAFTGRTASDPVNIMETETIILNGTGSQTTSLFGTPLTRWGDYSAMQVDPSDDCTFWYTSEYLKTDGAFNWSTRIANFKFPNCGVGTTPSTTALSPLASVNFGDPTMFIATVSPSAATGSVTFRDGNNAMGSSVLNGGSASFTTSVLTAGNHSITALYSGDATFAANTSPALVQVVNKATPVITWPVPAPITFGTALGATQLNATTTAAGTFAYTPAAGTVLNAGHQTLSVTFTPGDTADFNNAAASVPLTVSPATTSTLLSSFSPSVTVGSPVTLTATVTSNGGTPSGTVSFNDGPTALGNVTLVGGSASLNTSSLATGPHLITASYSGSQNFTSSVSLTFTQNVTDYTVSASPASLKIKQGQSGTVKITVSPLNGFDGQVSFGCSGLPLGDSCTFSPARLVLNGSATDATLTIVAGSQQSSLHAPGAQGGNSVYGLGLMVGGIGFMLVAGTRAHSKRSSARWRSLLLVITLSLVLSGLEACQFLNSLVNPSSPPASVTVTTTSGFLNHNTTVVVTVDP